MADKTDLHAAFSAIDKDSSGEITISELREYATKMNYKPEFTEKWIRMFDQDHSGTISYEEYCNTLGLKPKKDLVDRFKQVCEKHAHTHAKSGAVCFSSAENATASSSAKSDSETVGEHVVSSHTTMSKSTPAAAKTTTNTNNKKDDKKDSSKSDKPDLGFLEEDDEFEEFPAEDWADTEAEPAVGSVWEDNWDDDIVEEDFTKQLRSEFTLQGIKAIIPDVTPTKA